MDLIDRQAVLERLKFKRDTESYPNKKYCGLESAIAQIQKIPSVDAVSRGVYEQIKWERDIAMEQLEEHGIAFGAKKQGDAVEVVRCKDCKHGTLCDNLQGAEYVDCVLDDCSVRKPSDYCSYGERKEDNADN